MRIRSLHIFIQRHQIKADPGYKHWPHALPAVFRAFLEGSRFLVIIDGAKRFRISGVIIGIVKIDEIIARGGNKSGKQGAWRQGRGIHAHHRSLVISFRIDVGQPAVPFNQVNVSCYADFSAAPPGPRRCRCAAGSWRGHGDGEGKSVFISGFLPEALWPSRFTAYISESSGIKIFSKAGEHAAADGRSLSFGNHVHDSLGIDCIAKRLPHSFIGKRLRRIVQVERLHQVHGSLQHLVIISQLVPPGRWSLWQTYQWSRRLKSMTMESVLAHTFEGNMLDIGRSSPVIVEFLYDKILLGNRTHIYRGRYRWDWYPDSHWKRE